jgi:hypothetical protein
LAADPGALAYLAAEVSRLSFQPEPTAPSLAGQGRRASVRQIPEIKGEINTSDHTLLPANGVAKFFGVHRHSLQRWLNSGRLTPWKIAGRVYVTLDSVEALVAAGAPARERVETPARRARRLEAIHRELNRRLGVAK